LAIELIQPNRGDAYISVWPSYCDTETIERVLSTWTPEFGLEFPSDCCEIGPGLWCALFGVGTEDFAIGCFHGDVEATLGDDCLINAGF
jgi:hypothetical protein